MKIVELSTPSTSLDLNAARAMAESAATSVAQEVMLVA